jgi:hypothetical protein
MNTGGEFWVKVYGVVTLQEADQSLGPLTPLLRTCQWIRPEGRLAAGVQVAVVPQHLPIKPVLRESWMV